MTTPGLSSTPRSPRSTLRRRAVGAALLLLPILELAVLIRVGAAVGIGVTLLLLLAGAVAGSIVLRQVGAATIRRLSAASRRDPAVAPPVAGPPPAETALLVGAGLLLIVPGFLSDVAGLLLLVPAVRRALVRRAGDAVLRRFRVRSVRVVQGQVMDGGAVPPAPRAVPVDVRVIEAWPPGGEPR